jgi:hypothetical protein
VVGGITRKGGIFEGNGITLQLDIKLINEHIEIQYRDVKYSVRQETNKELNILINKCKYSPFQ